MAGSAIAKAFDRQRLAGAADWLAGAVAVSLPWSTSATSILVVIWLLALIPTLTWPGMRRELTTAAGGLPVLLVLLGALGMLWAEVPWQARLGGLDGFVKLLVVPLLIVQFRRSDKGERLLIAFLMACVALLIASVAVDIWPQLSRGSSDAGVPVKNYIIQSAEFAICAAVLLDIAFARAGARQWAMALGAVLLALAFVADIFFVVTSRTTLVILPILALVYGFRRFGWKGLFGAVAVGIVVVAVAWTASPYLRARVMSLYTQTKAFETRDASTSTGERLVFWTKSLQFVASAPLFGHGTGSITAMFRRDAIGRTGVQGEVSTNPHNLTFAVAIQIGIVGAAVLWAMWLCQLYMFRGPGLVAWIGLVVVMQNLVGSLFNSFIFDFTEGWLYVFGVGVLAGMMRRQQDAARLAKS
jgi:O-antigen ligase